MSPFRPWPWLAPGPGLVTVLLALVATLVPVALVAAATSPLGYTLGQTTLAEVRQSLPPDKIKERDRNSAHANTLIEVDPAAFDFDGLEQVLLIFDHDQLVTVVLTIAKRRFRDVLADLRAKYSVDSEDIDNFMQNGEARFRSGEDWIYLEAPHLSFSIELTYATDEPWHEMIRDLEDNEAKKRRQERGKL